MQPQQRKQTQTPTPSDARRKAVNAPGADDGDRTHRPPSSVDSVLESIGKAITEPIRDASEDEPEGPGAGSRERRPGS